MQNTIRKKRIAKYIELFNKRCNKIPKYIELPMKRQIEGGRVFPVVLQFIIHYKTMLTEPD